MIALTWKKFLGIKIGGGKTTPYRVFALVCCEKLFHHSLCLFYGVFCGDAKFGV